MSYKKSKIAVVDVKSGYNKVAKIYKNFHNGLASYDKWLYQRFLPRELSGKMILDIGSWDARLYSYFADKGIGRYIWFDTADQLLKRAPSRVERVVGDIEETRPFEDASIDVGLCFFVLVHIRDIQNFFQEAKRVIKPWWSLIILHNFQRRSYTYDLPDDTFKIQDYHRKSIDIELAAHNHGFTIDSIALTEKSTNIWVLYNMKA